MKLRYNSFKELPLGVFKELIKVQEDNSLDAIDTEIKIMSILCDVPEDDILNLSLPEYTELRTSAQWIAVAPQGKAFCPKSIKLDNQYNVCYDMSKLTTAQFIDFQAYIKLNQKDKYLSHILSVFLIPKGKKYGEVPVEEIIKDIDKNLSVEMAQNMCFFFITEFLTLQKLTLTYLEEDLMKKMKTSKGKERIEIMQKMQDIRSMINGVISIV